MTTKHDYTALDAAILEEIGQHQPVQFCDLYRQEVREIAALIAAADSIGKPKWQRVDEFRVVDRRLQAMRKKGLIAFSRRPEGWSLVKKEG